MLSRKKKLLVPEALTFFVLDFDLPLMLFLPGKLYLEALKFTLTSILASFFEF